MVAAKAPPCFVHRDDAPSCIVRRQRVEDDCPIGGRDVAQLFLVAPQQKGPAVTVHDRIHLARRHLLQALLGLVQHLDQRENFFVRVPRR